MLVGKRPSPPRALGGTTYLNSLDFLLTLRIELHNVHKQFDEFTALRNISETIRTGDRISILGHNGAGKSTLLNAIATLTQPSTGTLRYFMDELELRKKLEIRSQLSYLSHEPMLYPDLTAYENLKFVGRLYGQELSAHRIEELLESVGMKRAKDRLFRTCSRGMQQRLSLARSLIPNPSLLLLDEPFSGLDSHGVLRMQHVFHTLQETWVMVSHDFHLSYSLSNRFWVLRRGKLIHNLKKADLSYEAFLQLCQAPALEEVLA